MWAKTYLQKLSIDLYCEKLILRNNLNIQQMENSYVNDGIVMRQNIICHEQVIFYNAYWVKTKYIHLSDKMIPNERALKC